MDKEKNKSKKKPVIIIIGLIILAVMIVGGVVVYNNFFDKPQTDSNGVVGKISDNWDIGNKSETSPTNVGIQIPGYGTAEMKEEDENLHLSIGNPKSNECGFYATLKLDDGTVLYESELLKPGFGLTEVPLSQTLNKGKYTAMVCYDCVSLDEKHTPLNSAESEFLLIVK